MKRIALAEVSHWHADFYASAFKKAGSAIVGVSSRNPEIVKKYGNTLDCQTFQDHVAMINTVQPDFVMAMGVHADMPNLVMDLLSLGVPFGVEKPLGLDANDLEPLLEEMNRRKSFVAVPLVNRYSVLWEKLSELEQAGRVGIRLHAHFRIINGIPERYEHMNVGWMLNPALSGGGCIRNLGIHAADAFLHFSGEDEYEVIGSMVSNRAYGTPVEEMGAALVVSKEGVIGTLEAGYSYPTQKAGGDFEWRISASNCYLIDRLDRLEITTLDDGLEAIIPNLSSAQRYEKFCFDTLERLSAGRQPIASVEDCYRAMKLLDRIYQKAKTP